MAPISIPKNTLDTSIPASTDVNLKVATTPGRTVPIINTSKPSKKWKKITVA